MYFCLSAACVKRIVSSQCGKWTLLSLSLVVSIHYLQVFITNIQLLDMVSFNTARERTLTNATPEAAMTAFVK